MKGNKVITPFQDYYISYLLKYHKIEEYQRRLYTVIEKEKELIKKYGNNIKVLTGNIYIYHKDYPSEIFMEDISLLKTRHNGYIVLNKNKEESEIMNTLTNVIFSELEGIMYCEDNKITDNKTIFNTFQRISNIIPDTSNIIDNIDTYYVDEKTLNDNDTMDKSFIDIITKYYIERDYRVENLIQDKITNQEVLVRNYKDTKRRKK